MFVVQPAHIQKIYIKSTVQERIFHYNSM